MPSHGLEDSGKPDRREAARRLAARLGRLGAATGTLHMLPAKAEQEAASYLEQLGYGALWIPESVTGKEIFSHSALLLAATQRLVVGSAVANIYARDAVTAANGARTLAEAYDGRIVLGLGVSHAAQLTRRGHTYRPPVAEMTQYLEALEAAPWEGPALEHDVPVILGALGPRMLALAAGRALGAMPTFVPVEHTAYARQLLGSDPVLAVKFTAVVTEHLPAGIDLVRSYERARHLAQANYINNLKRLGWPDEELADGGSDRLLQALTAIGSIHDVADRVRAHLDAGADHVAVQFIGANLRDPGMGAFTALATEFLSQ